MNLKKDPKWQITSFIQYGPMKKALRSLEEMSDGMLKDIIPFFPTEDVISRKKLWVWLLLNCQSLNIKC